jgi:hypothetical protein
MSRVPQSRAKVRHIAEKARVETQRYEKMTATYQQKIHDQRARGWLCTGGWALG